MNLPTYAAARGSNSSVTSPEPASGTVTHLYEPRLLELLSGPDSDLEHYLSVIKSLAAPAIDTIEEPPDVIYAQDYFVAPIAGMMRLAWPKSRVVAACHLPLYAGFTYFDRALTDDLQHALEAMLLRFAERVVVPSEFTKRVLLKIYSVSPDVIVPIQLGVRLAQREDHNRANREPGMPIRLGTVVRFTEQKGVHYLVDVLWRLRNEGVDFTCTVVGRGPRKDAFVEACRARNLDEVSLVSDLGADREIFDFYRQLDIFLSTSLYETFGLALLEAMTEGAVPIAFDIGAVNEVLRHDQDALLVPVGDVDGYVAGVKRLATDTGVGERLSKQGIETGRRFPWSAHTRRLTQVFDEVCQ